VLTSLPELLDPVHKELSDRYGPTDFETGVLPFDFTDYYAAEMGKPLVKKIWSFENLAPPSALAAVKKETNDIEAAFAAKSDIPRPVNIDPGYVTPAKLVLASAKDFAQRIYIGHGIYAEVTLAYEKGKWLTHRWTYADYKQESYQKFFSAIRDRIVEQLK
jgi:hypothetical protein